jgi:hypothetical protein
MSKKTQWKPGTSGNPNGRPKGAKNTWTKKQKEFFRKVCDHFNSNPAKMIKDLEECSPKDRIQSYLAISKVAMSKAKQEAKKMKGSINVTIQYESKELPDASNEAIPFSDFTEVKDLHMNVRDTDKTS